jgi:GalNAc-alpha-(1->4)-GalNAc-alpha-(1->3)-diNAcBac-PP-undecaprenol alpha-1,4-N-acetyl-D-galactosaminyltransferase
MPCAPRVCCVIASLGMGGAERNMTRVAAWLQQGGFTVTLLTLAPNVPDVFSVPSSVTRVRAEPAAFASCRWYDFADQVRRSRALRAAILGTRPDVVLTFGDKTNISVLLAMRGSGVPVVVSERAFPDNPRIGTRWRLLRRVAYPSASSVVVVSEDSRAWAGRQIPRWTIDVVPNSVPGPDQVGYPASRRGQRTVLGIGRLVPQKGFDLLIAAFAGIVARFPDWELIIYGEGPDRARLEQQVRDLGLGARVSLPGTTTNVAGVLRQAGLFVLSSRYEGFPNALAEAMACGVAVVATNCPGASAELIHHGVDGLLVPSGDVNALSQAMSQLMADEAERARFAVRATENLERFSEKRISQRWCGLIARALSS